MFSKWRKKRRKRKSKKILNNANTNCTKYYKQSHVNTNRENYPFYSRLFISV